MPRFAHEGDAGLDLLTSEAVTLAPGERRSVGTGLSMEIPEGHVGLIWERSGLAFKHGIKTFGGVVDAGYRGEISICLWNTSEVPYEFKRGDKIAQMLIQAVVAPTIEIVDTLSETVRGENGFGSTGK